MVIEWAIDYRTYFEEINAKPRKNAEENNYTVCLKGLTFANLHGKYRRSPTLLFGVTVIRKFCTGPSIIDSLHILTNVSLIHK